MTKRAWSWKFNPAPTWSSLEAEAEKLALPCVASWKPVLFAHFFNAELLGAVASYICQK